MGRMVTRYNEQVNLYRRACEGEANGSLPRVEEIIDQDPKNISWSSSLKGHLQRGKVSKFNAGTIVPSMYRPFCKQWLYFDRIFNHRVSKMPALFPTHGHENIVIATAGRSASSFSALATRFVPESLMIFNGQFFPLHLYEQVNQSKKERLTGGAESGETPDARGYVRRGGITNWAIEKFRSHYGDDSVSREDLFWYIYGILHSPEYRTRFEANLKKEIPRIPFAGDFRAFSKAGKALGDLHLNYETADPYALTEDTGGKLAEIMSDKDYKVRKMKFGRDGKEKDKTSIVYNDTITLRGIPPEAYGYVVNGKPAIEWIMDRYQVRTDKDSGIRNDPNDWAPDNPRYILDLLKRIVTVSVESVKIINALPPLNEHKD